VIRVRYLLPCLATGGLERMVHLLCSGLDRSRFAPEVEIYDRVGALARTIREAGIPVRFDKRKPGPFDLRFLRRLAGRLHDDPPDLLHTHNITSLVFGAFAARIAGARLGRRIPVVYTEHDRAFPGPLANRALHFTAGRLVDRVVVVARWIEGELIRWEAFPPDRIEVIPNGVEGERFEQPVDALQVRASLGVGPIAPLALCVARLVPVKNHALLLGAWRRVADIWPDALLLLAGDGPDRAALERKAEALKLGRRIRFLGDRADVPQLLAAADLHVLTSSSEGMSLTLLEAMAAGKVSVATAVGGNPEVLEDGRTGVLVPPGDLQALASALVDLLQHPERARSMGAAARRAFRERYTVEAMIARYEDLYLRTLSGERWAAVQPGV